MKLVIGGAVGKRAYAEGHDSIQKWANGEICPRKKFFPAKEW